MIIMKKTAKIGKYEMLEYMMLQAYQNSEWVKGKQLSVLIALMKLADDENVPTVYWDYPNSHGMNRGIVCCEIPSLALGTDFGANEVGGILYGIQFTYDTTHDNISLATTHDLNSATIRDVYYLLSEVEIGSIQ